MNFSNFAYHDTMNKTFKSIIGEITINAIPMDKSEITPDIRKGITKFISNAIESAGGANILIYALDSEKDLFKRDYLAKIYNCCNHSAKRVEKRVAMEAISLKKGKAPIKTETPEKGNPVNTAVQYVKTAVNEFRKVDSHKEKFNKYTRVAPTFESEKNKDGDVEITVLKGDSSDFKNFDDFFKDINAYVNQKASGEVRKAISVSYSLKEGIITIKSKEKAATEGTVDGWLKTAIEAVSPDEDTDIDAMTNDLKSYDSSDADYIASSNNEQRQLDSKMTDDEYGEFVDNAKSLDISKVAEIVNKKVIDTITSEKDTHQKIEDGSNKLKDAILNNDEIPDETAAEAVIEKFTKLQNIVHKNNEHKSLFSKLQIMAIESVMSETDMTLTTSNVSRILTDVTTRGTFKIFTPTPRTLNEDYQKLMGMKKTCEASECNNMDACVLTGNAFAVIIMAFLETLHTLNMLKVNSIDVKNIVEKTNTVANNVKDITTNVSNSTLIALETFKKKISSETNPVVVESIIMKINDLKSKIVAATECGVSIDKKIMASIDNTISMATTRKNNLEKVYDKSNDFESKVNRVAIESDVMSANRVFNSFKHKQFDKLLLIPTTENVVDIVAMNGNIAVYSNSIMLSANESIDEIGIDKYISMVVRKSNLNDLSGQKVIRGDKKIIL